MTDKQMKTLMQFAEFEEEDGSPVAVCDPGCGKTFRFGVLWRIKLRGKPAELGIMRGVCWCAYCGTIVGEDECGRPYRIRLSRVVEALEHRDRALEWLAANRHLGGCPAEWHIAGAPCPEDGSDCPEDRSDCWVRAALKAAEEASDDH